MKPFSNITQRVWRLLRNGGLQRYSFVYDQIPTFQFWYTDSVRMSPPTIICQLSSWWKWKKARKNTTQLVTCEWFNPQSTIKVMFRSIRMQTWATIFFFLHVRLLAILIVYPHATRCNCAMTGLLMGLHAAMSMVGELPPRQCSICCRLEFWLVRKTKRRHLVKLARQRLFSALICRFSKFIIYVLGSKCSGL